MPPAVGRYHHQNLSNPFGHLNQQHLQHPNANLQAQGLTHPAFQANNPAIFGPSAGNAALQGGFGGAGGLGTGGTGLASHAAQMGFQNVVMQQQQAHDAAGTPGVGAKGGDGGRVRQVWKSNLAQEMSILRKMVEDYPFVSMDTEFPGVVARPIGDFVSKASYHYQTVRCNVDLLKIIQFGLTLWSPDGETVPAQLDPSSLQRYGFPPNHMVAPCTWTFNFKFSTEEDMYNEDSIQVLKKAGVDLDKHAELGIEAFEFAALLITSGFVTDDSVTWMSFHGGYDFAYLTKLMWNQMLPKDEEKFGELVRKYFPNILDVKFLLRHAQQPSKRGALSPQAHAIFNALGGKSGLQDLADELGVQRIGTPHTAGSDAHLTGQVFWAMREKIFGGSIPEDVNGHMWGLTGVGAPASVAMQNAVIAAQGHQGASHANGGIGFHTGSTPGGSNRENGPSTPTTSNAGLGGGNTFHSGSAATPGPAGQHGMGAVTPGGVFGNFQYGGNR